MAKKILVVDDEPFILRSVSFVLQKEGYEVFCASNGAEALNIAWDKRPDLIILDLMMPVMDGIETLSLIRKEPQLKDIPVIMLTAVAVESSVKEVLRLGVDDYILKPYDSQDLIQKVKDVLERGSEGGGVKTHETDSKDKKKVLIADSKSGVIELAKSALGQSYEVIDAVNGPQVITKAIEERPDLIIMEPALPLMDGFEVVKKLRKMDKTRDIKIYLLCSPNISAGERNEAWAAGFNGFIPKPFDPSNLLTLVNNILGGSCFPITQKGDVLIINIPSGQASTLANFLRMEIPRKVEEGKDKIILKFENPKEIGIQQAEDIISVLKHIGSLKVNLKFVIPSKEAINKLKGFYELQDIKIYSDEEEAIKEFNK